MESAVGERAAEPLMEEEEEQGGLGALLVGEAIGITGSVALDEAVPLELAQIVAELVDAVGMVGKLERGEDGLVYFPGGPASDMCAAMQENLQETDGSRVVNLDPGIANSADDHGHGEVLEERKIGMDVEPLRLEAGEAGSDSLELLADGIELIQAFLEAEVLEIV